MKFKKYCITLLISSVLNVFKGMEETEDPTKKNKKN